MPKIRLTDLSVKNAKPLATQYMLWDATLPLDKEPGLEILEPGAAAFRT